MATCAAEMASLGCKSSVVHCQWSVVMNVKVWSFNHAAGASGNEPADWL